MQLDMYLKYFYPKTEFKIKFTTTMLSYLRELIIVNILDPLTSLASDNREQTASVKNAIFQIWLKIVETYTMSNRVTMYNKIVLHDKIELNASEKLLGFINNIICIRLAGP